MLIILPIMKSMIVEEPSQRPTVVLCKYAFMVPVLVEGAHPVEETLALRVCISIVVHVTRVKVRVIVSGYVVVCGVSLRSQLHLSLRRRLQRTGRFVAAHL
jgi:hypothetical protein